MATEDKTTTSSSKFSRATPGAPPFGGGTGEPPGVGPPLPNRGHCLLTAGAVGAGKSTLQHAIIHRLYTDDRINLTFRNMDGSLHHDPDLQEWIFRFDRGEFPERTKGRLQTFFVEFGQKRRLVRLSFVETSGEDYQAILPRSDDPEHTPYLHSDLEHILRTETVKKLFLFVADTTRHRPERTASESTDDRDQNLYEDMLFSNLLNRFRDLGLNRINLLFVAAKWDMASNRNLDPARFFRRNFPQTRAALRRFPKAQVQYIRFTIGSVQQERREGDDGVRTRVAQRDFKPVERVIQWIYTHATGHSLPDYPRVRPTLWERIKGWVAT